MKKFFTSIKSFAFTLIGFCILICVWELLVRAKIWTTMVLPSPLSVAQYLWSAVCDKVLLFAILTTLKRLLMGYAIGIVFGIPLGVLCARSKFCRETLGLLALGLQALPSVCWAPLAVLWFGMNENAMLFVVFMGTIWSILLSTQNGVMNIPPIYIRAAKTMGSKGFHTWVNVIMPASFPSIVGGMKQGWAFAWRSLMAAEIYVSLTTISLGQLLHYGRENIDMAQVIAIMIVVVLIGLLADKILFSPWEKVLRKRWGLN